MSQSVEANSSATRRGLLAWFVGNHIAANLLMLLLMLGGMVAINNSTIEIFPEIDPHTITISVPYPGSTPEEVEESINRRIEEAVTGIEGVDKIRSTAAEGAGTVIVELSNDADDREVLDDVKSAVEQIQNFPPEDAEDPEIVDTDVITRVITIALYGNASERTLRELAYRIRDDVTSLDDISIAKVVGVRDYEIGVEVSEQALRKYNLSFAKVAEAVRNFSLKLPGGTIRSHDQEILLRSDGQAYHSADFAAIAVATNPDGTVLRLGDIGTINDGFEAVDQSSLFNGKPAAYINVSRVGNQKVLEIEESIRDYVQTLSLPAGLQVTIWSNRAEYLRGRTDLLVRNGLMGLTLVFAVLLLFLELRLAFWTTMGIPISFLGAFLIIYSVGGTINMISLFAFILVLGIVVDDAIIVGESIYNKREQGLEPLDAAIEGLHEVINPVSVGILTTVLAFAPLLYTRGDLGQILWIIPVVVISVLLMSLLEACLILPAHLAYPKRKVVAGAIPWLQETLRNLLQRLIDSVYTPVLKFSIRQPWIVVASVIAAMMLIIAVIQGGHLKVVFFPPIDADTISAKVRMPSGTPATETRAVIERMLDSIEQVREDYDQRLAGEQSIIRNISASVGSAPFAGRSGPGAKSDSSKGSHFGEVKIELLRGEDRPFKASRIEADWREQIGEIPGAEITFKSSIMSAGDDINIELAHADFEQLLKSAERVKAVLHSYAGVSEIKDSFEAGKPELQLSIKPSGLAAGLTLRDLARQVRQAYYGEEAQRVQRGRDDIKVLVRYSESERRSLASIHNMRIRLQSGQEVPFHTVADIKEGRGYATINRADRRQIVTVSAKVDKDIANANEINARLRDKVLPDLQSDIPGLFYSFEGKEKERMESVNSLIQGLSIAMIAIFSVLAVQLRSYTQPLIIMSVIPVGFIGAAIGHMLLGYPISFFSMFGLVALSGVVVNDSLILIDMTNRLLAEGMPVEPAIIAAGRRRFRPIMFTTLTTCAGLGPIISEKSLQAQFLIPMAISLAFGVAFATLITLIVVPALVKIRSQFEGLIDRGVANQKQEILDGTLK
ncbi:MAG TPA: efflux RND transporter permease subunit [Crenotrichaceae bacterium]|nr:efflux RND transporter permease subunit [Crenotrichaceae bacterium]